MADTHTISSPGTTEADDLRRLARRAAKARPAIANEIEARIASFTAPGDLSPPEDERACESFAQDIRRLWLSSVAAEAAAVFRSPTDRQQTHIARRHDAFGYERDLQPVSLEARCHDFFPKPPPGWEQDHIICSSGQAATTIAMLALAGHVHGDGSRVRVAHRGAYFETRELLSLLPFVTVATFPQTAEVIIEEPVSCDGEFHRFDVARLLPLAPRAVLFDTTLMGRTDGVDAYLAAVGAGAEHLVLRVTSSLKLLQSGLELANCGILSVYSAAGHTAAFADRIRTLRTLCGAGLHMADAMALEAPWFLDAKEVDAHTSAIFANNAALAAAVRDANDGAPGARFKPVAHPSFAGEAAPFCAFRLRDEAGEAYASLDSEIQTLAARRDLNLSRGGSFGFRGHRYEIIEPKTGEPPFLRVAMGRSTGWSRDGVIRLMSEIAGG